MRASVSDWMLWETDTSDNLVRRIDKTKEDHIFMDVLFKVSIVVDRSFLLVLTHIVGCHVIVVWLLPTVMELFALA